MNKEEFKALLEQGTSAELKTHGFGRWDTMNNIIAENSRKPVHQEISIPVVNEEDLVQALEHPDEAELVKGRYIVNIGRQEAPIEPLAEDQDVWLIPGKYYDLIQNGTPVTGLYGEEYAFEHGKTDDDTRFGMLPYGVRRPVKDFTV